MKTQSKLHRWIPSALIGLALGAGTAFGATPIITVNTFDNSGSTADMWNWYGGSTFTWDGTQDHTGNGGGSLYISQPSASGDDTIIVPETWLPGCGQWWAGSSVDLTTYSNISLYFKWDKNNSTMTLDQFNSLNTGGFTVALNDASGWGGGDRQTLAFQQIPDAASNGWVHLSIPLDNTIPFISSVGAIEYYDWKSAPWPGTVAFWIDDVTIIPNTIPIIPNPTLKMPFAAVAGLNIFAASEGNSYYDRQEVYLTNNTSGLGWIGQASSGRPVSYSFTIASFPNDPNGPEAYLFLSPNPATIDTAPDWNETNCVVVSVQTDPAGDAIMSFQYKVNEAGNNQMFTGGSQYTNASGSWDGTTTPWYETGNLGSVTNPASAGGPVGKWTVTFTSSTQGTLYAPNGNHTTITIPSYNVGYLNDNNDMNVFLGMQANNAAAINKAVVYSAFSISGASSVSDNFLADASLNTNTWSTSYASDTSAPILVPPSVLPGYWLQWTLPDGGFSLEANSKLTGFWSAPSAGPTFPAYGVRQQLVAGSDLPAGPDAFFRLVKRQFTQMLILWPGETNAPNTPTGKTGTPTPVSFANVSANGGVTATVYACDANFYPVNGVTDAITADDSDESDTAVIVGNNGGNTGNLATGGMTIQVGFIDSVNPTPLTVTVTDTSTNTIPVATSSPLTINP